MESSYVAGLRTGLGKSAVRGLLPVAAVAGSAVLLADQLAGIAFRDVTAALSSVPVTAWLTAIAATLVSFLAVARYDALFHGWLGTGVGARRASTTGAASIALAQILGYGLITGTLARWRALPELSFRDALRVTNYVSFSFIAALIVLSSLAAYAAGMEIGEASGFLPWIAVLVVALTIALSFLPPKTLPFRLPSLRLSLRVFTLTAVDTAFAAIALWVLLPAHAQPEPALFVAAFLVALTGGFLSGAPGGMGPFELCMIALLPAVPQVEFLAAILAFRIVYYALPACLAICIVARPTQSDCTPRVRSANPDTRRAEAGLAALPGHRLTCLGNRWLVTASTRQSLVAIGDPVCGRPAFAPEIGDLATEATERSLWPLLYKVSGQTALAARHAGWSVVAVGEELWLSPSEWQPDGRRYRQFRRKIRKARDANVEVTSPADLPLDEMERVSNAWALAHGGERGFSMGYFERDYLSGQRCYLARAGGDLVAFVTFHVNPHEWTLDLMRSADAPCGTMHALLERAIADARALNVPRLSLAALPPRNATGLLKTVVQLAGAEGLRQFKDSIADKREPLYMAAPSPAVLMLAGLDIARAIRNPPSRQTRATH